MRHRRAATAAVLALLLVLLLPAAVGAHSELVSSNPADGATLTVPPLEVSGDFSEELDATRSVMELRVPGGDVVAIGRVPGDGPATRMEIVDLPALDPGTYEVRWTTITADDDGVERGTFTFTVVPTSRPSASPTAELPTTTAATAPSSATSAATAPTSAPRPTAAPSPGTGSTTGDLLVPVAILVGVLVAGAAWLLRRRR